MACHELVIICTHTTWLEEKMEYFYHTSQAVSLDHKWRRKKAGFRIKVEAMVYTVLVGVEGNCASL